MVGLALATLLATSLATSEARADEVDRLERSVVRAGSTHRALAPLLRWQNKARQVSRARYVAALRRMGRRRLAGEVRLAWARAMAEAVGAVSGRDGLLAAGAVLDGWHLEGPAGRWRGVDSVSLLGVVPLGGLLQDDVDEAVLRTTVSSPRARRVRLVVGPASGVVRLTVNGDEAPAGRARLVAGDNTIVVRAARPDEGAWRVDLAVMDAREVDVVDAWEGESGDRRAGDRAIVLSWARKHDLTSLIEAAERTLEPSLWLDAGRLERRSDRALRWLARVPATAPEFVPAQLERARRLHARGQSLAASDVLRSLPSRIRSVESVEAMESEVLMAELLAGMGAPGMAYGRLNRLAQRFGDVPAVRMALAVVTEQRRLPEAAIGAWATVERLWPGGGDAAWHQAELWRGLGRGEEALEALTRAEAARPDQPGFALVRVDLLRNMGRAVAADAALTQTLSRFPASTEVLEAAGRHYLETGRRAEGLAAWRSSLALVPRQPQLRARLRRLEAARADGFEAPYRWDVGTLVAEAAPPGKAAVEVLGSQRVTRLDDDGTSSTWMQRVVRINRVVTGVAERTFSIGYDPSRQSVEVLSARHLGEGGERRAEVGDEAISESWYALYYEQRVRTLTFRGLAAGDVLVVEHRVSDFAPNPHPDAFGDLVGLQEVEAQQKMRLVWLVAPTRAFRATVHGLSEASWRREGVVWAPRDEVVDGQRVWSLEVSDLPALPTEPGTPGYTEVGAYVHASGFATWDAVGRWYHGLVVEQGEAGAAVRSTAQVVAAGLEGEERVAALHAFASQQVRYVGLEFGEHGYRPYAVEHVLDRRFGDCKDKSTLLLALLAEHGVESRLTLVRTRRHGRVDPTTASPAVFDHAILYIPSLDRYVDPTATWHGLGELPTQDQGASALVVGPDGGRFVTLPVAQPDHNRLASALTLTRDGAGTRVEGELDAIGAFAPPLRKALSVPAERRAKFEEWLAAERPGVELRDVRFEQVDVVGAPVRIWWSGRSRGRIPVVKPGTSWVQSLAPRPTRAHPLELDRPFVWRVRVTAPAGTALGVKAQALSGPFGALTVDRRSDGFDLEFALKTTRVEAAEYPLFRDFLTRVDAALAAATWVEVGS